MENPKENQESSPETGIEKIVSKWMGLYAPNLNRSSDVDRKMEELTVNYMSLLLLKADQIAEFNRAENIQANHVASGIKTLDINRGLIRGNSIFGFDFFIYISMSVRFGGGIGRFLIYYMGGG